MRNEKLVKFRKSKKLNMKEMYYQLNVSKSYYEKIEYGQRKAGNGFVVKMINTFPNDKDEILRIFF